MEGIIAPAPTLLCTQPWCRVDLRLQACAELNMEIYARVEG